MYPLSFFSCFFPTQTSPIWLHITFLWYLTITFSLISKDDGEVDRDERVIDICLIRTMDEDVHFMDEVGIFYEHGSLVAPLEGALVHLNHTMQEIIEEGTQ